MRELILPVIVGCLFVGLMYMKKQYQPDTGVIANNVEAQPYDYLVSNDCDNDSSKHVRAYVLLNKSYLNHESAMFLKNISVYNYAKKCNR